LIFVTVGNGNQQFERLLQGMERLVEQGVVTEEVVVQSGNNPNFRPVHCRATDFVPLAEFERLVQEARAVVSHAGAGTVIHTLRCGKTPVVMPRRRKYGEHLNDHQIEIVEAFASEGLVIPAYEPDDLAAAIASAKTRGLQAPPSAPVQLIGMVSQAIEELMTWSSAGNPPTS